MTLSKSAIDKRTKKSCTSDSYSISFCASTLKRSIKYSNRKKFYHDSSFVPFQVTRYLGLPFSIFLLVTRSGIRGDWRLFSLTLELEPPMIASFSFSALKVNGQRLIKLCSLSSPARWRNSFIMSSACSRFSSGSLKKQGISYRKNTEKIKIRSLGEEKNSVSITIYQVSYSDAQFFQRTRYSTFPLTIRKRTISSTSYSGSK